MKIIRIITALLFSVILGNLFAHSIELPQAAFAIVPALFATSFIQFTPMGSFLFAFVPVDVLKKDTPTPAYTPIKHILTIFRHRDVSSFPARDANGVKISANLGMASNKNMIRLEVTPGTVSFEGASEGDADARAVIQKLVGDAPGYELELAEFIQNNLNENLGAILEYADGSTPLYFGDEAAPLQLVPATAGSKDKISTQISLESAQKGPVIAHYFGTMTYATDNQIAADDVTPSVAAGSGRYVIPNDNAAPVEITSLDDAVKGMIITLVGSGGSVSTINAAGEFILEGDASWSSNDGATITFEVFADDVFIERSRT